MNEADFLVQSRSLTEMRKNLESYIKVYDKIPPDLRPKLELLESALRKCLALELAIDRLLYFILVQRDVKIH